jgi:hypothetical protein
VRALMHAERKQEQDELEDGDQEAAGLQTDSPQTKSQVSMEALGFEPAAEGPPSAKRTESAVHWDR